MSESNQPVPDGRSMTVPESAPPTMEQLLQTVGRRRRQRRVVRVSALGAAAVAVVLIVVAQRPLSEGTQEIVGPRMNQSQIADVEPSKPQVTAVAQAAETNENSMRLFARVSGDSPVFQFDRETNQLRQVGWLRSQQIVPVDMRHVPDQQQQTFNAVLHHQPQPLSL